MGFAFFNEDAAAFVIAGIALNVDGERRGDAVAIHPADTGRNVGDRIHGHHDLYQRRDAGGNLVFGGDPALNEIGHRTGLMTNDRIEFFIDALLDEVGLSNTPFCGRELGSFTPFFVDRREEIVGEITIFPF